jgi:hypothetical protein
MFARLCLLSILSMGAFAAPAFSWNDGMPAYAQVGGWQVRVDPAVGNGCFASQYYEDGTGIKLGIDPERHNLYLILGNLAWTSLEGARPTGCASCSTRRRHTTAIWKPARWATGSCSAGPASAPIS